MKYYIKAILYNIYILYFPNISLYFNHSSNTPDSGVRRKKFRGGFKVMAGLVECPGAELPGRRKIFENLYKKFLIKLQKCIILAYFARKFNKSCANFSRVWTKNTNSWETCGNFRKLSKSFLRKLQKCIMLAYFSKE